MSEPNQEEQTSSAFNWQTLWPYRVPFLFFSFGIVFLFVAIFLFYQEKTAGQSVVIEQNLSQSSPSPQSPKLIKVDVSGAVVNPGVYELKSSDRIQEALIKAGGLAEKADREWVAKNLNLAQKLPDGAKIYIPKANEQAGSSGLSDLGNLGHLININSASAEELESLSGIGPVTSQKIISGRPYESIDDLLNKKIVGKSVWGKIKDKITVY